MFQSFIYFLQITGIKIIFFIEEPDLKFYHNTENLCLLVNSCYMIGSN